MGQNRDEVMGLYSVEETTGEGKPLGSISPFSLRKHIARSNVAVVRLGRRVFLTTQEIERIQREGLPSLRHKEK